jgi:hypothetical protein
MLASRAPKDQFRSSAVYKMSIPVPVHFGSKPVTKADSFIFCLAEGSARGGRSQGCEARPEAAAPRPFLSSNSFGAQLRAGQFNEALAVNPKREEPEVPVCH